MTRSNHSAYTHRHERHISRNGQTETRSMKKMGAGVANWGVLGDEVMNVHEMARTIDGVTRNNSSKLSVVDSETFEHMREQQS
ncbi:hypothetical protein BDB01DRAFT_808370 [Pilobolus umbonatus]|nr:hypothetical protein BDB01DRAFT_808370 [Pilobolus umbonatus]